ncbi:MAG: hypothetical protein SFU98_00280 [Leptospiraceae bacterium]|nr:hypothetical protein [Leptospiraceae bacterium]
MKFFLTLILAIGLIQCSKKAAITYDGDVFSDPELKNKISEVKKGTIVLALDYRNHAWGTRDSIKVKIDSITGYISPKIAVIDQDPEKSVYKWGHRPDYKYFYDPNDKKHYKNGYEFSGAAGTANLKDLPKTKVPLDELLQGANLEQ